MSQYDVGAPAKRVAMDILGPLPESESGNKYLLLVADYLTEWPEAHALQIKRLSQLQRCL